MSDVRAHYPTKREAWIKKSSSHTPTESSQGLFGKKWPLSPDQNFPEKRFANVIYVFSNDFIGVHCSSSVKNDFDSLKNVYNII